MSRRGPAVVVGPLQRVSPTRTGQRIEERLSGRAVHLSRLCTGAGGSPKSDLLDSFDAGNVGRTRVRRCCSALRAMALPTGEPVKTFL